MRFQARCQRSHLMRPAAFSPEITEAINEMIRKAKGHFAKPLSNYCFVIFLKLKNASQVYDLM